MPKLTFLGLKDLDPLQQALVCACLTALFSVGCLALRQRGILAWNILTSPVILYAFMNPIMGIFVREKRMRYIGISFICFAGLCFWAYLAGSIVSLQKFSESRELVLFTMLITMFYFMAYLLSFVYKGVLSFLEEIDKS